MMQAIIKNHQTTTHALEEIIQSIDASLKAQKLLFKNLFIQGRFTFGIITKKSAEDFFEILGIIIAMSFSQLKTTFCAKFDTNRISCTALRANYICRLNLR